MEILEGDALHKALLERYSKNPRGWSFTVSPSPRNGFFDARVAGPEESWHLKLDTIFKPSPFVIGARTDKDIVKVAPPISFGFRRLNASDASAVLDDSPEGMRRLLAYLGAVSPTVPSTPGSYLQGPFVYSDRAQIAGSSMTREQQRIDTRLSDEMTALLRRRYPSYG